MLNLGAHLARHDNTRKSIEKMLGLIIGKETVKCIPLKELGCPQLVVVGKAASEEIHEGDKTT